MRLLSSTAFVCVLALLSNGCFQRQDPREPLPMQIGEWRRTAVENIPAEEHAEELKRMGIKQARRGIYQKGEDRITAAVYEYGGPSVAFELVQKFRPEPGKIAFHQDRFFVTLQSPTADVTTLNSFASQLEGVLKE